MRHGWWVFVFLLLCSGVVRASDDKAAARAAYSEGTRLFELGEYDKALAAFKRAYLAYDEPALLFNLGQCYRQLGDKPEAIRSYRQYLRKVPEAPDRAGLEAVVARLERELADERAAAARTAARPAPAPAPARVEQGAAGPPAPAPAPAPAALTKSAASPALVVTATPARADRPVYKKWWLWTIVGGVVVAGAAVGVGVALAPTSHPANDGTTLAPIGPRTSLVVRF